MAVPANVAIAWPSTAASIPSGWTRVTELDNVYIVGAAAGADTDLATARGNATHLHTSPAHTPTQQAHTGTGLSSNASGISTTSGTGTTIANQGHTHTVPLSSVTAVNDASTITVDATANDLAHTKVIWIKSDGTPTSFPIGSVIFCDSDTLPSGWARTLGTFYLKGAVAAGNGGATAGANTHTHTSPAHTHTQQSHNHTTPATSSTPDITILKGSTAAVSVATNTHTHGVTISAATATNNAVTTTMDTVNHEPVFKYLNAINNALADYPIGAVALWLGANSSIPSGWSRLTSLDTFWPKFASANGQVLTTGGATTHAHTASSCQPTQNVHTHTMANASITGTRTVTSGAAAGATSPTHTHTWSDDGTTTAVNNAVTVTINACSAGDAYPLYRTVIFIKLDTIVPDVPTVRLGGYTSYQIGRFDIGGPEAMVSQEVGKKIAQGDLRFVPR